MNNRRKNRLPQRLAISIACLIASVFPFSGCIQMAALWTNITGGDIVKAEFKLTSGPLLILIDDPKSQITEPRGERDLHRTISARFLENDVNKRVVPYSDLAQMRQSERKFDRLATRDIGEKLGADQVLHLIVERFTLNAEPGAPIFKGEYSVRVRVLSTERKHDVRLWPREQSGKLVAVSMPSMPSDSEKSASEYAAELAAKLGDEVSKLFYDHRGLDK